MACACPEGTDDRVLGRVSGPWHGRDAERMYMGMLVMSNAKGQ